jgi:hypothetical protein
VSTAAGPALRGVGVGRIVVGSCTLATAGRDDVPIFDSLPPRAIAAARVLAARDLVQGATLVLTPDDRALHVARNGSAVDCLHAASMLPLIVFSARYRRAAVLSAASALAWIAVTSVAQRSSGRV